MVETLIEAAEMVERVVPLEEGIQEVVGDKGYHSTERVTDLTNLQIRTYISEPNRGRRRWKGDLDARDAVYANRRRIRGQRGRALLRRRGELLERPFTHLFKTGGMRRTYLRGHSNILKRLLIHVCAFNLGLVMRKICGVGTPRSLQGRLCAIFRSFCRLLIALIRPHNSNENFLEPLPRCLDRFGLRTGQSTPFGCFRALTTDC